MVQGNQRVKQGQVLFTTVMTGLKYRREGRERRLSRLELSSMRPKYLLPESHIYLYT